MQFSDEQQQLRQATRRFLDGCCAEADVRAAMETETGFQSGTWTRLGAELGLCGLAVPERYGGGGGTFVDVGVVLEEMGKSVACLPYFSTVVLAQQLLLAAGDPAMADRWLPPLASGAVRGTVAVAEDARPWAAARIEAQAHKAGGDWRISGVKRFVLDGHTADIIFVAALTPQGISLFAVDSDADGLTRRPVHTMDLTRKQAHLDFTDVHAELVGSEGAGWPVIDRLRDLAAVGLSAEAVGGMQRVLDMSVNYAKGRIQFGRPIGSFQAIKHKCADMLTRAESAKSAAYHALWAAAHDPVELPIAACLAKVYCADAYLHCAAENIQIHGGIGFTWEHSAHLYLKRAKTIQLLFGDSIEYRELLAERVDI